MNKNTQTSIWFFVSIKKYIDFICQAKVIYVWMIGNGVTVHCTLLWYLYNLISSIFVSYICFCQICSVWLDLMLTIGINNFYNISMLEFSEELLVDGKESGTHVGERYRYVAAKYV